MKALAYDLTNPRAAFAAIDSERKRLKLPISAVEASAKVASNSFYSWLKLERSPTIRKIAPTAKAFGFALVVRKGAAEFDLSDQCAAMTALDDERGAMGMSLGDMEDKSGVSVNSFYYWKSGKRSPQLVNLVALAQTLGFEVIMRRALPSPK